MSCGQERSLVLGIFTSGVVQLRLGHTGLTKENWTQELLASKHSRGFKFYDPTFRSLFETGNVRFLEDVEFAGEDNIRKVVFEEKLVSFPSAVIDGDQAPIPDFTIEPIIEQDNTIVPVVEPEVQTQQPQELPLRRSRRSAILNDYIMFLQEH